MDMKNGSLDITRCIHCGRCKEECAFLSKYGIDIGDTKRLPGLAYSCFLCGKCTSVCPVSIDGKNVVINYRYEHAERAGGKPSLKGYGGIILEKTRYKFRNYRNITSGSVLFTGCNLPSFYPLTTASLVSLLKEKAGIGVIYDCCGKPVSELGMKNDETRIIKEIDSRLKKAGVKEVITACPNCYYYLKDRLHADVVFIYEKLKQLGIGNDIEGKIQMFLPCPDRYNKLLELQVAGFFREKDYSQIDSQCCGLGGCANVREPGISGSFAEKFVSENDIYVYCATCAGKLSREGIKGINHVLAEILGTHERPDTGRSLINRARTKFL